MIKQAKKVIIVLFLWIVMVFGVVGCNAGVQDELQAKIEDLQSQITEMEDRLAETEGQISERDKKIDQLEKELAEKTTGKLYSLQEAYDNGWLTQADVMSIAYYNNGGRTYNEEIMSEDYEPLPKTPEVLSNLTELKIKSTAAKEYREKYKDDAEDVVADDFRIIQYCGTYGDCVVTMMTNKYTHYLEAVWIDTVAGVTIHYSNSNSIKIWRETK